MQGEVEVESIEINAAPRPGQAIVLKYLPARLTSVTVTATPSPLTELTVEARPRPHFFVNIYNDTGHTLRVRFGKRDMLDLPAMQSLELEPDAGGRSWRIDSKF